MCAFIQRKNNDPLVKNVFNLLGLESLSDQLKLGASEGVENFYPAFGGDPKRTITNVLIQDKDTYKLIDATWWFDCRQDGDSLMLGKRTTFNARNLDSPFWNHSFKHHRAIIIATGFGETTMIGGKKHQYLMEANEQAILLGGIFRIFENDKACCSIITRDATTSFSKFHEKAMPLMLPMAEGFLKEWLNPEIKQSIEIDKVINKAAIRTGLKVTEVKSFKSAEPIRKSQESHILEAME